MTTIEKLKELERDLSKGTHNLIVSNYLSVEDVDECIIALEKQKPKKPIKFTEGTGVFKYDSYKCTVCGVELCSYYAKTKPEYCFICGGRLDWSDEK